MAALSTSPLPQVQSQAIRARPRIALRKPPWSDLHVASLSRSPAGRLLSTQSLPAGLKPLRLQITKSSRAEILLSVAQVVLRKSLLLSRFSPLKQPRTLPGSSSWSTAAAPSRNTRAHPTFITEHEPSGLSQSRRWRRER